MISTLQIQVISDEWIGYQFILDGSDLFENFNKIRKFQYFKHKISMLIGTEYSTR